MIERSQVPLSELTTLRLGGPAERLVEAASASELIEVVRAADAASEPVLLVAGGSNLVVADRGWAGTAALISTRGIELQDAGERVRLTAAAGEPWEELVALSVSEGLAGFECLAGIPGSTGATPIQNVGAYGAEVSSTIAAVRCWDRERGERVTLAPEDCAFGYRDSLFKRSRRYLVLEVSFELERSPLGHPIRYAQLAEALGVEVGERVPLGRAREAVLGLRRGKGMVLDPADPDSTSAGSFFTNPVLDAEGFAALERRITERLGPEIRAPAWNDGEDRVKTSAAWLIERAGFARGYGEGRAGISNKHTLALVNRGGATTAELLSVAREVRDGVREAFGVSLVSEPTLVGVEL